MRRLNLGCGKDWREYEADGLDIVDYGQKYVCDVRLWEPECPYDEVVANHFLEHFSQDELRDLFNKIWMNMKRGGLFKFVVPHKDREEAWDLTHKTFWNENTVRCLEKNSDFGCWNIEKLVVNERKDIHVWMRGL